MKKGDLVSLKIRKTQLQMAAGMGQTAIVLDVRYNKWHNVILGLDVMWDNGSISHIASPGLFEVINED